MTPSTFAIVVGLLSLCGARDTIPTTNSSAPGANKASDATPVANPPQIASQRGDAATARSMAGNASRPTTQPQEASPEQTRELLKLLVDKAISEEQIADVMEAADARQEKEGWTDREKLGWVLEELKKSIAVAATQPKTQPTSRPATGKFGVSILDIRIFSPTFGIAVGDTGILTTDGSLGQWKAVSRWANPPPWVVLAGGSEKAVYITVCGKTPAIWKWTSAAGLVEIRKLPPVDPDAGILPLCEFANDRVGAFIDSRKLMVTLDGAATWVESPLPLDKNARDVKHMAFCGDDAIVISSDSETVALLKIDKKGHAKQEWRTAIFGRFGEAKLITSPVVYDRWRNVIWVYSEDWNGEGAMMQGFDPANGKVVTEFKPVESEAVQGFSVAKGRMYIWGFVIEGGGGLMRIWDTTVDKPRSIAKIEVAKNSSAIDRAFGTPGTDETWILLDHWQLVKWDGKPIISYWSSKRHGPVVDTTIFNSVQTTRPVVSTSPASAETPASSQPARP